MNKEQLNTIIQKYKPYIIMVNNALLYIGLFLIAVGIGATYQANHDVKILNESLYNIATSNGVLTDGVTYYYIGLYENRFNFSSTEVINRSLCYDWYGVQP